MTLVTELGRVRCVRALSLVLGVFVLVTGSVRADEVLRIPAVYQRTPVWCWAAVGEMVFRFYRIPSINPMGDYQCGIVGGLGGPCWSDCRRCVIPLGQMANIAAMIEGYPALVERLTGRSVSSLSGNEQRTPLDPSEIVEEIEAGRPIVIGISPSGFPYPGGLAEHVALIVGYKGNEENLVVVVNDPFPFELVGRDPYLLAGGRRVRQGRYEIRHDRLVQRLRWNTSITVSD